MINGLYSGAAAMQTLAKQQELISSNLMHANSSGHRRVQPAVKQRFEETSPNTTLDLGPEVEAMTSDFTPGRITATDRPLDISIAGDGFFVYENGGQPYLTRNGRLFRDPQSNTLVNEEGVPIRGENGPITIDRDVSDREITISTDGTVSAGDRQVGRIQAVAYEDNGTLIPVGALGFTPGPDSIESDAAVKITQFGHELSNVQPVSELIALIVNTRQHEAVEKATRTLSDSLKEYIRS
ncbi:Flagellar basal-body rod protein FlgF [Stieleria neptunia]|uniref:Flagellar basal-body rod protein FlgF n=1 Tax=Stieleria neptunia TaxID=2527979 RepID=A0A518HTH9_9BACT|nr:flagellar hook basal-body protein [Stieleria neptunia]QDV44131.1 Flagellar basal-body rod protein FlgF [Stieleria neptunia]